MWCVLIDLVPFARLELVGEDIGNTESGIQLCLLCWKLKGKKNTKNCFQQWKPNWNLKNGGLWSRCFSSLHTLLLNVEISEGYFHFKQCLWQEGQDIVLISFYRTDEEIRKHSKMCAIIKLTYFWKNKRDIEVF